MGIYRDSVINVLEHNLKTDHHEGIPTPLKDLTRYTNYVKQGDYIVIAGRPTAGKRSFAQFNYMISICKWAIDNFESNVRPNIKFFYFGIDKNRTYLLQKLTSLYLKLEHNIVIDPSTIRGEIGELYSLKDEDQSSVVEALIEAEEFFDEVLESGMIEIITSSQTPTSIHNTIEKFMLDEVGEMNKDRVFEADPEWSNYQVFYIIDDVQSLSTENYGNVNLDRQGIYKIMHQHNISLKKKYRVNPIVLLPIPFSASRRVIDTIPSYKDLGVFYHNSDLGIVLYNPFNEGNYNYHGYDIKEWIFRGGKVRFRSVTIVRNKGAQNITKGLVFLEECSYFAELPVPGPETNNEQIQGVLNQLALLH